MVIEGEFGGTSPPAAIAEVCVPLAARLFLAVFKLLPVTQAPTSAPAPVHSSDTAVTGGVTPAATAES